MQEKDKLDAPTLSALPTTALQPPTQNSFLPLSAQPSREGPTSMPSPLTAMSTKLHDLSCSIVAMASPQLSAPGMLSALTGEAFNSGDQPLSLERLLLFLQLGHRKMQGSAKDHRDSDFQN